MKLQEIKNLLNEVIDEVLKEEDEENTETSEKQEDDIQEVSEPKIKSIKAVIVKVISEAVNKVKNNPADIEKLLKNKMGLFGDQNVLTGLQNKKIPAAGMTLKIRPLDIKEASMESSKKEPQDNLKKTNTMKNASFYEKLQIMPFELVLENNKKLGGGKSGETYQLFFLMPAFFAIIENNNIAKHEILFDFKHDAEKGQFYHSDIFGMKHQMVYESEYEQFINNLKTGRFEKIKAVDTKQVARRSTSNET